MGKLKRLCMKICIRLKPLTWIEPFGLHHPRVDDKFDPRDCDWRFCDIGGEDNLPAALHNNKKQEPLSASDVTPGYLRVCRLLYLGRWLEDPELLCWGQRCVQRDDHHGAAAIRKMLCDVSARPGQSLDLLLACHEHQDIVGMRCFLRISSTEKLVKMNRLTNQLDCFIFSCQQVLIYHF